MCKYHGEDDGGEGRGALVVCAFASGRDGEIAESTCAGCPHSRPHTHGLSCRTGVKGRGCAYMCRDARAEVRAERVIAFAPAIAIVVGMLLALAAALAWGIM